MMQQYLALKQEHQDEVLFFRLGDFYEMFMDDAREISHLLNLTLTTRCGVPMCGIPYHAAKNYLKRLLDAGKKIAICEQLELTDSPKNLARREVVQILTPGTVVDDEFLEASRNNFLLCIALKGKQISCSYCDVSSGMFSMMVIAKESKWESLRSLYEELGPRELLVNEDDYLSNASFAAQIDQLRVIKTKLPSWYFSTQHGFTLLKEHTKAVSLKQFGLEEKDIELISAGALFHYLQDTAKTSLSHLTSFRKIIRDNYLQIDEATRRNLEIIANLQDGSTKYTLFSAVDATKTSGGSRLLKQWLASPLSAIGEINARQEQVGWFLDNPLETQRVRQILSETLDVVRLTTRVAMKRAIPHDLVAIQKSIASFFSLASEHEDHYRGLLGPQLDDVGLGRLVNLMEMLMGALDENCQGPFVAGEVIKTGYNPELDRLRSLKSDSGKRLQQYLAKVKDESGINTIKLSYNRIIGHYLEISKSQNEKIPTSFYRKQTLVNAERYTTEELMDFETELLRCDEEAEKMERQLFNGLLLKTEESISALLSLSAFFSSIDCFQSFATIARIHSYCRPILLEEDILEIVDGRHPVVEQQLPVGAFVANPLEMVEPSQRFCLVTGPNMAGKSTYLRQNALIVLLAHVGSYVPATNARIGLTDSLFCRVGASDNLARGESTFLVEMQEAAFILRNATCRSLVIMDEIGRGTSTQDGMSIAYAVMGFLMEKKIKTLFATHYHELTMFDNQNLQLLTLEVAESQHGIVFLRKICKGVANSSYGLHVAKMAGIPLQVIREAASFQKKHFDDYSLAGNVLQLDLFRQDIQNTQASHEAEPNRKPDLDSSLKDIIDRLRNYPLEDSTPMQAMRFLEELKEDL